MINEPRDDTSDTFDQPSIGSKRYLTRTIHGSKRRAEDILAQMIVEAGVGGHDVTDGTVADLAARWLAITRPPRLIQSAGGREGGLAVEGGFHDAAGFLEGLERFEVSDAVAVHDEGDELLPLLRSFPLAQLIDAVEDADVAKNPARRRIHQVVLLLPVNLAPLALHGVNSIPEGCHPSAVPRSHRTHEGRLRAGEKRSGATLETPQEPGCGLSTAMYGTSSG